MALTAHADRDTVLGALDVLEAAADRLGSASLHGFAPAELLEIADRLERLTRCIPAVGHRIVHQLKTQARPGELGASSWTKVLAGRLRISSAEASRRLADATDLGPRSAVTGEPLEPLWAHLAAAQMRGQIGAEHVAITRRFFKHLPAGVDRQTRVAAEKDLARMAAQFRPEDYREATAFLAALLHPDGEFDEADRARRRGLTLGPQRADGLSTLTATLTPEARAVLEPILATLAATGMANPDDPNPCVVGRPTQAQIDNDRRSPAQRHHDAFLAAGRIVLSTKKLGELNGLPVTVIVSTTLAELESGTGIALTGGGTRLPIRDVIRNAAHAHHYLVIFDGTGRPLHLDRARRTASADQRIVLHARDKGCTKPGCTAAGYACQAHHLETDWAHGGLTNIDTLTLACGPDNRMATEFGWNTHLNDNGRVEWHPPPELDHRRGHGQPRINPLHHPQDLLAPPEDGPPGSERLNPTTPTPEPECDVGLAGVTESWCHATEPNPHDDEVLAYLLAHDPGSLPFGPGADDLNPNHHDIFGSDTQPDPDADTYDDLYNFLDPDLLAALDPARDHPPPDTGSWSGPASEPWPTPWR